MSATCSTSGEDHRHARSRMASLIGQTIEEYRLETSLGVGSVGETFQGVHIRTGARAALKVVHARLTNDGGAGDRLRRQLALLATVHDAHVLSLKSYGHQQGRY